MIKVFVTGSTGFVGSKLCKHLAQKGYEVHALYRSEDKLPLIEYPGIIPFKGSIGNIDSLKKGMQSCEYLFHTAAYVKLWAKDKSIYDEINVKGTKNVIDVARECGVKRAVFTSTAGTFGPSVNMPITEAVVNNEFIGDYERSKHDADQMILNSNCNEFETIIVYPTRIYGPGLKGTSNSIVGMIDNYIKGKWHIIPGNGKSLGNYVFIDDVVKGHIMALEEGRSGNKYILSGTTLSYNYFFECINNITQINHFLIKIPGFIMKIIAQVMQWQSNVSGNQPLVTKAFVRKTLKNWDVDSSKSKNELGYNPIPFPLAMQKTIDWLQNGNGN